MSVRLQEFIHKLEVGSGYRVLSYVIGLIVFLAVAVFYDAALYRNLSSAESMDAAQLGRNIAEGKGYHTRFIRPLSIHLLERHWKRTTEAENKDVGETLKGNHPDLANPPAYPYLLALAFKAMPFGFEIPRGEVRFTTYAPELWITGLNQLLFFGAVLLTFGIARSLFDASVAWLSAAVLIGTELLWRFSISGLPTMLLMVLFLGAFGALARVELLSRDTAKSKPGLIFLWATGAGLLLGLGALTKYSFGLLAIPAVFLLGSGTGRHRVSAAALAALVFAAVLVPWLARNYSVCGNVFGTASFSVYQGTSGFPGNELERTLRPEFGFFRSAEFTVKFLENSRRILQQEIPRLGGSWVTALFLASLLVPFRNIVLGRLRWFLVACLGMLVLAQGFGAVPEGDAQVRSGNLLVILAPAIFAYGVALLYNLLEQFAVPAVRAMLLTLFYLLAAAPLILAFLAPSPSPIVYPPYYPPWIQEKAQFIKPDGWAISDIPWAMAWYADRQSVWLPLRYGSQTNTVEGFYALHARKPVEALYLTPETLNDVDAAAVLKWRQTAVEDRNWNEFQALVKKVGQAMFDANAPPQGLETLKSAYQLAQQNWVNGGGDDWLSFVLGVYIRGEVPVGFPLRNAPLGHEEEIFLTESERPAGKSIKGTERSENP